MNRLGIELTSSHCRLVEVVAPRPRTGERPDVRVTAFATIAYDDPDVLARDLRTLVAARKLTRRASVALWGVPGAHQGGEATAAVASGDVRRMLEPMIDAGLALDAVVTPPLALAALARLRDSDTPGTVGAFLAVNRDLMSVAFVRDGHLLFAREMPWGHRGSTDRDAFAARLAAEVKRSILFFKQTFKTDVVRLVVCGDLPDVRMLTAPLIAALDIEVETGDSLDGIDMQVLPSPAPEFREQVAALRLAWAVAAAGAHPVNLLPEDLVAVRAPGRRRLAIGAAAALAAVVVALLFWPAGLDRFFWGPRNPPASAGLRPRAVAPEANRQQPVELAPAAPQRGVENTGRMAQVPPAPAAVEPEPAPTAPRESPPRRGRATTPAPLPASAPKVVATPAPAPAAPDPVVGAILYSADRRVAIIDGRIVGVGDQVGAAVIVEIRPDAVIVRGPGSDERSWPLRPPRGGGKVTPR